MKECQVRAMLTFRQRDGFTTHEVVERMDCDECDRHVVFRSITGMPILFLEVHMRNLLAELCENCCGAEDAPYENNAERVYDNYNEGNSQRRKNDEAEKS